MAGSGYTFEQRAAAFWEMVDRQDGCWTWKGAVTSKHGYGCFQVGNHRVLGAHKIAWLLTNGDPGSLCVLHRCDNRVCVNPAHLFLWTKQDNTDDAIAKGRHPHGEMNGRNVLTAALCREILARTTGKRGEGAAFAREYGVSFSAIHALLRGESWAHLPRTIPPVRRPHKRRVTGHESLA